MKSYIKLDLYFVILLHQWITDHSMILGQSADNEELKVVERCHPNTLPLICSPGFTISIKSVVLGETDCSYYFGTCCPKETDCTEQPSEAHRTYVNLACNGQQTCSVTTARESIRCKGLSEFERITYRCIELQQQKTPTTIQSTDIDDGPPPKTLLSTVAAASEDANLPIINGSGVVITSSATTVPSSATAAAAVSGKKSNTVLVVVLVVLVILIGATVVIVLFVRHRKALKSQDHIGDDNVRDVGGTTMGFRQLEFNERSRGGLDDAAAAATSEEEPLYELEVAVTRDSTTTNSPRVVIDNDYGDHVPARASVYSEPAKCTTKQLNAGQSKSDIAAAESCELMEHGDDGNTYDEVSFVGNRTSNADDHVYGNVRVHPAVDNSNSSHVYSEAAPLIESAYNAPPFNPNSSSNNNRIVDEDEYVMPTLGPRQAMVAMPTSHPGISGSDVYCAMENHRSSKQSLVDP